MTTVELTELRDAYSSDPPPPPCPACGAQREIVVTQGAVTEWHCHAAATLSSGDIVHSVKSRCYTRAGDERVVAALNELLQLRAEAEANGGAARALGLEGDKS